MIKTLLVALTVLAIAPLVSGHNPAGTPKLYCESSGAEWLVHEYGALPGPSDGSTLVGCPVLPLTDGHDEYALLGAWLLVESGLGVPSSDPNVGSGTIYCFGEEGHHSDFVTVSVDDVMLGAGATFTLAADTIDLIGTGEGCGDFQSDVLYSCTGTCTAYFPAGLDGSYQVYIESGSAGHVVTN